MRTAGNMFVYEKYFGALLYARAQVAAPEEELRARCRAVEAAEQEAAKAAAPPVDPKAKVGRFRIWNVYRVKRVLTVI